MMLLGMRDDMAGLVDGVGEHGCVVAADSYGPVVRP